MHFALSSAAVPWCWVTAHLYEEQIFTGVFALTQACCEPVLQSSSAQWGMHFALSSAAVPWCTYEEFSSYRCALTQHQGISALLGQNVVPTIQCCPA